MLFISHAGEETDNAKELARRLQSSGVAVWLDAFNLKPGVLWQKSLEDALQSATAFLVYVGKSGVKGWVDREVRLALSRNVAEGSFPVVPVLGPGSSPSDLPVFLSQHQYLDLRDGIPDGTLIAATLTEILSQPVEPISVVKEGESPFLGLLSFREDHSHLFFGRDKETEEIIMKMKDRRFLAVIGDSGTGKSSLLRAGLVPALLRGRFEQERSSHGNWVVVIVRPGNDPFSQLAIGLSAIDLTIRGADRIDLVATCKRHLAEGTEGLTTIVASLVPPGNRVLILVDQFEELFTQFSGGKNLGERRRFVDTLIQSSNFKGEHPIIHVLISLRADFFSHCWEHYALPRYIADNQFAVTRMSQEALRKAMEEPVKLCRCSFETGLVDKILDDLGEEPGNLPLLQHALHLLWRNRTGDKLTHKAYFEIGKVNGAIAMQAEQIYQSMSSAQQTTSKKIFLRLTSLGEGTQDTRRRATMQELLSCGDTVQLIEDTVELLAGEKARLITLSGESITAPNEIRLEESRIVEVAHEALISHWPRLREWLNEDRESLLVHRKITQATNEWLVANRDVSFLFPKSKLAAAEVFIQKYPDALTEDERAFIEESIQARESEILQKVAAKIEKMISLISSKFGSLEMEKLIMMTLSVIVMKEGLGFGRCIYLSFNEEGNILKGEMGINVHNTSVIESDDLNRHGVTLELVVDKIDAGEIRKDLFSTDYVSQIQINLDKDSIFARAIKERIPLFAKDLGNEGQIAPVLLDNLKVNAGILIPLVIKSRVHGLLWADRAIDHKPIIQEDFQLLVEFSQYLVSAIEIAQLFEQVRVAEQQALQQLQNIFESMHDMVYFTNKDCVIKSINKAVSTRLGLTPTEVVGKKCYEVFHHTDKPYEKCPHNKTLSDQKSYIEELDDLIMGCTFLTSISPIFDLSGDFIGSVHVVRDITELKKLSNRIAMSEKMAALGEVAAKVAHEIRSPLVSVGGFAKRLEKKLEGNLKEYASIIVKEVSRLEGVLREILGFVKEVRLARENTNFNILVNDVLQLMEADIMERGILFERDYCSAPDIFIDPQRVKEAIANIIVNAIQSITGSGSIYIRTYIERNNAVLEIKDTGRGIPPTNLAYIFNPFFTTSSSGTGLGLAITHRIIQEHNGKIEVESEVGKGSVFRVYLPIADDNDTSIN